MSILARHAGAEVRVADIDVNFEFEPELPIFHKKVRSGTDNLAAGPAMSLDEAVSSIEAGISIVDELVAENRPENRPDMIGTGAAGAAVAMELLNAATRILADIKTFEEAGIENAGTPR